MAPGGQRVIDKMPRNFLCLGYIRSLFPMARVIHCSRDPVVTCLPRYFRNFTRMQTATFGLKWLDRIYRDNRRQMRHWLQVLNIKIHEVWYE